VVALLLCFMFLFLLVCFLRIKSERERIVPEERGLTKRRQANGPDDRSAQTPRRRAGRRNRDEAVDCGHSVSCRELFNHRFACMYLFITKDTPY